MANATKSARKSAIQSVRDGAAESTTFYDWIHGCDVSYVRDSRGIVLVRRGPAGEDLGERVVSR